MGAGLLAKAQCQSAHMWLTHRIREQARSHIFYRVYAIALAGFRHSIERSTVVRASSSKCHTARIFARSGLASISLQLSVVAEALSSRLAV